MNIHYIERYGYPVVFLNVFLESFGFPLPGEITMTAAAVLAGRGSLNIIAVLLFSFAAAVAGDNIGYAIGKLGGRKIVLRYGRYVFLTERRLAGIERLFVRYGGGVIFVARFFSGLRQLNGIIAGTLAMPWKKFILFNAAGAALWVGAWGGLAYALGRHAHTIYRVFRQCEAVALIAAAGGALLFLAWRLFARRRAGR